ncbi:hypothetical protein, partial [Helicobacter typhlonius]
MQQKILSQVKIIAFLAFFVFCVAFGLRLYFLEFKQVAHMDEILSIVLSEYNEYGWGKNFEPHKIYTAKQLQHMTLWNDSSLSGALSDVKKLYVNNRDDPHTNLYYSLLRLWHIGFIHTDLKQTFYRGISLNFVFFTCSFVLAFMLYVRLFGFNYFLLYFLALAFLNPASINNTLFMRPYALQEMSFLLLCYVFVRILQSFKNTSFNIPFLDNKDFALKLKKYIKIWSICIIFAFGFCFALRFFTNEIRYAQVVAHNIEINTESNIETKEIHYKIEGKMLFSSFIFRDHSPYIVIEPMPDSMKFTSQVLSPPIHQDKNPRYLQFDSTKDIQKGEIIGNIAYTLHISYKLYVMLVLVYVIGCVLFVCVRLLSYEVLILAICTAFALLSGYFALIFVVMIYFLATLWAYRAKAYKDKLFFATTFIYSLLLSKLLYPNYFSGFVGGRGKEVGDKLSLEYVIENFYQICTQFFDIFTHYLSYSVVIFGLFGLCLACAYALKYRSAILVYFKSDDVGLNPPLIALLFGICALLWAFVVIFVAPYKDLRYIMSIFPLLFLLLNFALVSLYHLLSHSVPQYVRGGGVIIALWFIGSIMPFDKQKIDTLQGYRFTLTKEYKDMVIPQIVLIENSTYYVSLIIPYLPKDLKVMFIESCEDLSSIMSVYDKIDFVVNEKFECALDSYDVK